MPAILNEFRAFVVRGNVVDLAVAVLQLITVLCGFGFGFGFGF